MHTIDSAVKKDQALITCYNINESWKYYAKWKKPDFEYCI